MRRSFLALVSLMLVAAGIDVAGAGQRFGAASLRGRFTGNLTISEKLPVDDGQTLDIEARQLLALTFDGKSEVTGIASIAALVPGSPPFPFACIFTATGVYDIGEEGLGTATLALTPTTDCAGPLTLKMTLLVGGKNRGRIDVTIDGASGLTPTDPPIPLIGSGVLVEQ